MSETPPIYNVGDRCDDAINAQMENIAKFENVSTEELEQHWLHEEKFIS